MEDDLVHSCSEIKVLERALQVRQDLSNLDDCVENENGNGSESENARASKREQGNARGHQRPLREQLLYQLALKKEETHNLALELAHKTNMLKANEDEILKLMNQIDKQQVDVDTAEAHVAQMTEQLIQYDLAMKTVMNSLKNKDAELESALMSIEKLGGENSTLARKLSKLEACNGSLKSEIESAEDASGKSRQECDVMIKSLKRELEAKTTLIKAAEEKLRMSINERLEMTSQISAHDASQSLVKSLQSDLSLLRRGLGEESRQRKDAEEKCSQLSKQVEHTKSLESKMRKEMETSLDDLRRVTRERDAAIQEVVRLGKAAVESSEIEGFASSKQLLQKALVEQLSSAKSQLAKERDLRMKAEDELRQVRRRSPGGSLVTTPTGDGDQNSGMLSRYYSPLKDFTTQLDSASSPERESGTAEGESTKKVSEGEDSLGLLLASPGAKLNVNVVRMTGVENLAEEKMNTEFRMFDNDQNHTNYFLEFSSTGDVVSADAVRTRSSKMKNDEVAFRQTLSMIVSPSEVLKVRVYKGSPFEQNSDLVGYNTVSCDALEHVGDNGLDVLNLGGESTGVCIDVEFVWGTGLQSPLNVGSKKTW